MALGVKNLLANARDTRDMSLIPGSGRSPGGGHGHPPPGDLDKNSCLEHPVARGAWKAPKGHKESDTTEAT